MHTLIDGSPRAERSFQPGGESPLQTRCRSSGPQVPAQWLVAEGGRLDTAARCEPVSIRIAAISYTQPTSSRQAPHSGYPSAAADAAPAGVNLVTANLLPSVWPPEPVH